MPKSKNHSGPRHELAVNMAPACPNITTSVPSARSYPTPVCGQIPTLTNRPQPQQPKPTTTTTTTKPTPKSTTYNSTLFINYFTNTKYAPTAATTATTANTGKLLPSLSKLTLVSIFFVTPPSNFPINNPFKIS